MKLRLISIEISWLGGLVKALGAEQSDHQRLEADYRRFKEAFTGGAEIDIGQAGRFGMQIRTRCLQIQLQICQRILDEPQAISGLTANNPLSN